MFSQQISTAQLIRLCHRVGTSLRSGLNMRRIWEGELNRGSLRHQQVMQSIFARISEGDTLVAAMRDTGYFPKLAIAMIEIGEMTGKLEISFLKLTEHYEHQRAMARQFIGGITWPGIQFGMGVLIVGLLTYAFGAIGTATGSQPIDLLGLGSGLSGMIMFFSLVGTSTAIVVMFFYSLVQGWFGPGPVSLAMHIPVLGACFRQMAMGRLTWSLGMGLDAGLDAIRSVELSIDSTQNPFYRSRGEVVKAAIVERNCEFYAAFREAGGFPDDFLDHLEAAELAGTLSESLVRMSHEYDDEAKRSMAAVTMIATGLTWMGVSGMLIFMIFRIASIYLGAINELTK